MDSTGKLAYDPETGLCVAQIVMWTVFMIVFVDTLSTSISNPVMPYYAKSFGVGAIAIGYMYSATNLAAFLATPLLGKISDNYGRRPVLLLACLGSGIAGLGQAVAPAFSMLFAFRTFSGLWVGVVTVAQVYISDISTKDALKDYLAYLAAVPNFSRTLGPGLGGGLSKFGVGIPILVDGVMSLLLGTLVYAYVPESPAFLAKKATTSSSGAGDTDTSGGDDPNSAAIPWVTYGIGVANFFNGIQIGISGSMLAISMLAKFQWDALHVGYLGVATSLGTLATTIWITTRLMRMIGPRNTAIIGSAMIAVGFVAMSSSGLVPFLIAFGIRSIGMGLRQGSIGIVSAEISNSSNRGSVFARLQMFSQAGQFIGPLLGGYIAEFDAKAILWWVSAVATFAGALSMGLVKVDTKKVDDPLLAELRANLGTGMLADEVGSASDYEDLARHVGGLLTRRHYRWISQRDKIHAMLDKMLPELSSEGEQHAEDLRRLLMYAENINTALK